MIVAILLLTTLGNVPSRSVPPPAPVFVKPSPITLLERKIEACNGLLSTMVSLHPEEKPADPRFFDQLKTCTDLFHQLIEMKRLEKKLP
jgi:hypothetical protein